MPATSSREMPQQQSRNAGQGAPAQLDSSEQQQLDLYTLNQQRQQESPLHCPAIVSCGWPELAGDQIQQSAKEDSWGAAASSPDDGSMMDHKGTPQELSNPCPQAVQDEL
jgi:hypothetical protein